MSRKLYRSRDGEFLGVCSGIAKWKDLPVGAIRAGVIIAAISTAVFPAIIIYVVIALILDAEPQGAHKDGFEDFNRGYRKDKDNVAQNIRREYENIRSRVSRMEDDVIHKEQDWDERFRRETT